MCRQNLGTNLMLSDFKNVFGSIEPKNNYYIQGFKKIRDWMYQNGITSEQAFEAISGTKDSFNLDHFEKNMKRLFNLASPEIESIFIAIDENKDGLIDRDEWLNKIYEDCNNPLQLLREVVNEHDLSTDDLLFKMRLRIWDEPLDFPKFAQSLRLLDNSLTDVQLRAMAKSMKNLKNLVEVPVLIRNLVGKDFETVDFRDKLFKRIYSEIIESNSSTKEEFKNLLIKNDTLNDGTIVAQDLQKVFSKVCKKISSTDIERFTRFLEKDARGRVDYTQFINDLEKVKDHNPFKNLVSRIKAFMKQNNQNPENFMRRLVLGESQSDFNAPHESGLDKERKVSVSYFTKFLKNKVDKKRDFEELRRYAELIDIDADGYISIHDLHSCLGNLNNETFYKNNGATLVGTFKTILTEREKFFPKDPLPDDKALEVIAKIKEALVSKGISFRELFARLDSNNDEFLTFTEFSDNIDSILKLSPIIKERLFALMDENNIGMVDYNSFLSVMKKTPVAPKKVKIADNFNWEYQMIEKIKEWIASEGITVEEAFKSFDRDFDGFIDLADLKWILTNILKIGDKSSINASQLERLFKLLDFHKVGHIQRCDIQRLVENDNPYLSTGKISNAKFMVGTDTFDWKNNAIQQIGIELSKNPTFKTLGDSFQAASKKLGKVRYRDFKEFLDENNALKGFNLTDQLLQQLFSELDPHKKGFLTESDWSQAFGGFNWNEQLIVELENLIGCSFSDLESAYEYFQVMGKSKKITSNSFQIAVNALRGTKLKDKEMKYLWSYFSEGESAIDEDRFKTIF
jgi:Ca2+-binding EF-hand superfamily protein